MPTTDTTTRQQQLLHDRGICAIIPTYNNAGTVADVVRQTLLQCADVIVVNDGSTDGTQQILADIGGITLVNLKENKGKGTALKEGFRKAMEMGFAYAITLDADGQHYPEDIALFLKANQEHPGEMIIGSRQMEGVVRSKGSNFANNFSNFWFYVQTGQWLDDTQTGYRLYPLKKLHGLSFLTSRYEAELELMVFASWHGVSLHAIPVRVYYPAPEERVSHFRPTKDFTRISILNTVLCFLAVVYGLPLRIGRFLMHFLRTFYTLFVFLVSCFAVITPLIWLYIYGSRLFDWLTHSDHTEHRRKVAHQVIYRVSRFVMIHHGIPGTTFRHLIAKGVSFDQPKVVICNHQSHLDLMCQLIFTPKIIFLTKSWVWNNPSYGFLIRNAEFYPVLDGIDELLPKLRSLADRGYSIGVFPEGTRSKDCKIARFHQGAFHIAEQLGLDIQPMYLYGAGKILPKKTYYLRKGPIHIEVGTPVTRKELEAMGDTLQQASWMHQHYLEKYEALCNKIEQDV
jgi:1-acyl-sn-glycerol-3-phosphate acyltransferase